eukprot:2755329-Rhodomonas_salina.3
MHTSVLLACVPRCTRQYRDLYIHTHTSVPHISSKDHTPRTAPKRHRLRQQHSNATTAEPSMIPSRLPNTQQSKTELTLSLSCSHSALWASSCFSADAWYQHSPDQYWTAHSEWVGP